MCALPACSAHINSTEKNMCFCVGQKKKKKKKRTKDTNFECESEKSTTYYSLALHRATKLQCQYECVLSSRPSTRLVAASSLLNFFRTIYTHLHWPVSTGLLDDESRRHRKIRANRILHFHQRTSWNQSLKLIKRAEIMHGVTWALQTQDYRISGDRVTIRCCATLCASYTIIRNGKRGEQQQQQRKKSHAKIHMNAKSSPLLTEVNAFDSTQ